MTETQIDRNISTGDLNVEASGWIVRRGLADWSDSDQAELDAWLTESSAHRIAFLRASDVWERADRLQALTQSVRDDVVVAPRRGIARAIGRTVALVALAGFIGAGSFVYLTRPHEIVYTTATGGHETVPLADGSQIELNTGTVLRVSEADSQRIVKLDRGEAYFSVRHNAARPFLVFVAGHRITDLGTKFEVRSDGTSLRVALLEGRAQLESEGAWNRSRPTLLVPGDVAVVAADAVSLTKKPATQLTNDLSWRRGILVFENMPLADAAEELNRYNLQKIVVADESVGRLKIDASIPINGVDVFARVAREVIGLRVEARGDELIISR